MKTILMAAVLVLASAQAHAAPQPNALAMGAKINLNAVSNQIITTVVSRHAVLNGMTNAERALGSNSFSLPLGQRTELRASLRVNKQGLQADLNRPDMYHVDVNMLTQVANVSKVTLRLDYRGIHRSAVNNGETRVVTFDNPADWSPAPGQPLIHGRLIARVQQGRFQNNWRTTRTLLVFESN